MYIRLDGLKFYARHGVFSSRNACRCGVYRRPVFAYRFLASGGGRCLGGKPSVMRRWFERVKAEMEIPSRLLEHVVYRIARRLLDDFPNVMEVTIGMYKQNPPMEPIAAGWG